MILPTIKIKKKDEKRLHEIMSEKHRPFSLQAWCSAHRGCAVHGGRLDSVPNDSPIILFQRVPVRSREGCRCSPWDTVVTQ